MKCQRHLHVLNRILVKREHFITHCTGGTAAAEVQNLIPLVNGAAGLNRNGAAAGDEAPGIQACTALHCYGTAGLHFYETVRADNFALRTAGGRIVLSADTDSRSACKRDRTPFCHGQRPERLGCRFDGSSYRSRGIAGLGLIKRNQQRNARRNGIVSADRTIGNQGNLGLTVCLRTSNRFIQICKPLAAGFKKRRGFGYKFRRNGAVTLNIQGSISSSSYALTRGQIVPTQELIALCRSGCHLIGGHRALYAAKFFSNDLSIHGISAVFSWYKSSSRCHIRYQPHISHGNFRGGCSTA